ncbi:MAG: PAS domain S-box protein [Candidatus Delongbacteria bacterium]|nr:PAS domain S-box protein [Candidatus Delongbacteria bacterium]
MEKLKILILEDNDSDLDLVLYELKKLKAEKDFIICKNKEEFIKALNEHDPDIILSDFNLPDIDGEEALFMLRDKDRNIPFILVSSMIGEEKAVELMRNGANDFIMKDKLKKLVPTIERELKSYESIKRSEIEHNEVIQSQIRISIQKDFYESILENITNGVWVTDKYDKIKYTNEEMTRIAGVPKNKIVGNSVIDGFEEKTISEFKNRYLKVKNTLFPSEYEVQVVTPDGKNSIQRGWLIPYVKDNKFDGMICTAEDVTEKVSIQRKIIDSEAKYKSLAENSLDRIERYDSECRHIYINQESLRITGFKFEDVIGKTHKELGYPEETAKEWDEFIKSVFKSKKPDSKILEIRNEEKTTYYDWRLYPEFDNNNSVKSILSVSRDITELQQKGLELKESEIKLKKGEKIAKFGYWQIDLNDNSVELSEGAKSIFELEGVFYDLPMIRKLPLEPYRITNSIAFNDLVKDGIPYIVEYQARGLRSQQLKYLRSIAEIDKEGKKVFGVVHDITNHKILELDLIESQRKFYSLYNNAPDMYASVDADSGTIIECNDTLLNRTGYKREEVIGINIFDIYHEDSLIDAKNTREEYLKLGSIKNKRLILKKKNGNKLHVNLNIESVRDENNKIIHSLSAWRDITEQKEHEELLLKQKQDLERSNKELEEFAYVASHDLQEPLRMISSFNQLLAENHSSDLNDEAKTYMSFAVEGAKRMQNLILGLLDYSRVSTQGSSMKITKLDTALHIAKCNLQMLIDDTCAEIVSDKLPEVMADETQMTIVFQNLIQNAIKFRDPDKKIKIQISSKFLETEDKWEITVEDNGIGINKKHLDKIFTIFHRLHNQQTYPGTGIGLSICKRIVQRHCGTIRAESYGIGKGTKMIFTIPSDFSNDHI